MRLPIRSTRRAAPNPGVLLMDTAAPLAAGAVPRLTNSAGVAVPLLIVVPTLTAAEILALDPALYNGITFDASDFPGFSLKSNGALWRPRGGVYRDSNGVLRAVDGAGTELPVLLAGRAVANLAGAADYTNNTVTFTDVGVGFSVKSGESWRFDFNVVGQISTATTGVRFRLAAPAITRAKYGIRGNTTSVSALNVSSYQSAFNPDANTLWTTAGANVDLSAQLIGGATFAADGEVKLQARVITAGDVLTVIRDFTGVTANRVI